MNKKKKSSPKSYMRKFIESKGFYIALLSLVVLIGFSIYARNVSIKNFENDLAFDDEAWQTALDESGVEFKSIPSSADTQEEIPESADTQPQASPETAPNEDTESNVVETSAPVLSQSAPDTLHMPCNGEILEKCSLEQLVYCSTTDDWRTHNGLDIAATEGEPVKAAAAGTISKVYQDDMLGIVVTVDHGGGVTTLYGNLQSTDFISVGTFVKAGDIIGGIGKSGALEADKEPHLHFEVYKDGELKNPSDMLQ